MATTNLEVYRNFRGSLGSWLPRFWPVFLGGVRVGTKRRVALVLLYAVPVIATVIYSFVVYTKYAAEAAMMPEALGGGSALADLLAQRALKRLAVRNQIAAFNSTIQFFALVTAAWYGAGLFVDDRRVGAHLLYFSRPLTRLDYFLGKFATAFFFSACAVMLPGLVICVVATFASPDWTFLTEEYDVILATLAYSTIWVSFTTIVALCASSLASRKIFAMLGYFAFFFVTFALAGVLQGVQRELSYLAVSPLLSGSRVAAQLFDIGHGVTEIEAWLAWTVLGVVSGVSLVLIAWRLRRLEVVG